MRISLVQMQCEKGDLAGNLSIIECAIDQASDDGASIVVFPEMSVTGYIDPSRWPDAVLDTNSDAVTEFVAMTVGLSVTAVAGIVERNPDGMPFITQLVASGGKLLGTYRKITIVEDEADWFSAGRSIPIFRHGNVPFGIAICADIDNPAIYATYAKHGAQIVLECAAPGLHGEQETRDWQSGFDWWRETCAERLGSYARTYRIYIAVATQAGRTIDEDFPGGGYLFGPDGATLAATEDWSVGSLTVDLPLGT